MRWVLAIFLMAFTPIFSTHKDLKEVDEEFKNIENSVQDQGFTVLNSTPALTELKDGQIVIFSCNTVNGLMWRNNQEIYVVQGSCVTILGR